MASETFDDIWDATGLGEGSPTSTLRPPLTTSSVHTTLPRLSVAEEGDPDLEGTQLVLTELLGEGGMGRVHLARQPLLAREVAVKRLRPEAPAQARRSLMREARLMGSLDHPHILPVHALGADAAGEPVLVMKRVRGASWLELLHASDHPGWAWFTGTSPDALGRHVELLITVCRAMHFAHSRGVLHLDLKPENAMLADDGAIYVLDWGVARRMDEPRGGVLGTPAYMAPELADPQRPIDARTDVFLLGACLYEVLAGRPPHEGGDLRAVLAAAHAGEIAAPEGPPALVAIAMRALCPEPEARFASAQALQEALSAWLRDRGALRLLAGAREAAAELEALLDSEPPDVLAIAQTFTEARFGYREATRASSAPLSVEAEVHALLAATARFWTTRENFDQAAVLVDELPAAHPARHVLATARREREAEREAMRDVDLSVGLLPRTLFLVMLGAVGTVVTGLILSGALGRPEDLTVRDTVLIACGYNLAIGVSAWFARRWIARNAINRSIVYTLVWIGLVILLSRVSALIGGATVSQVFAMDLMGMASGIGVGAAFMRSARLFAGAIALVLAGLLASATPAHSLSIFGWVTVIAMCFLAWVAWAEARSGR